MRKAWGLLKKLLGSDTYTDEYRDGY